MDNVAARFVTAARLRYSRSPAAFIAGGALDASEAAGIPAGDADLVIIAVPPGQGARAANVAQAALDAATPVAIPDAELETPAS